RLDPLADREEYAELTAVVEDESVRSLEEGERTASNSIRLRTHNLGVDAWGIWPGPEGASLTQELEDPNGPRCLVVDLGSLEEPGEEAHTAGQQREAV